MKCNFFVVWVSQVSTFFPFFVIALCSSLKKLFVVLANEFFTPLAGLLAKELTDRWVCADRTPAFSPVKGLK